MAETHGMRLNIDGSSAKRGADTYKTAVNQIINDTSRLQKTLSATSKAMSSGTNFRDIAKSLGELGRLKVDGSVARNLRALSSAMSTFKGPNANAIRNTKNFLRDLNAARLNGNVASNLSQISSSMAGFRGPSAGAVKNFRDFLRVLNTASVRSNIAAPLASLSASMSGFRGPTTAQTRNISAFFQALSSARINPGTANGVSRLSASLGSLPNITAGTARNISAVVAALSQLRTPAGAARLVSVLQQLTGLFTAASGAGVRFGGTLRGMPFQRASAGANKLAGDMRGLENSMSASYHIGSQLRVLFGSLTLGSFTKGVYDADLVARRFSSTLLVTSKDSGEAGQIFDKVRGIANRLGLDLKNVYEEFGKFNAAVSLSGKSSKESLYIFEQFGGAMRVMGLSADRQGLVWLALTQIFSKGTVAAQELKQQLGEQIPGAYELLQQTIRTAMGDQTLQLDKLMKSGEVTSETILALAKNIGSKFGPQVALAMARVDAKVARMGNAWFEFQILVSRSGLSDAIGDVAENIERILKDDGFRALAISIGSNLANAVRLAGTAVEFLLTHAQDLVLAFGALVGVKAASTIASIGAAMVGAGRSAGGLLSFFTRLPNVVGLGVAAFVLFKNKTVTIGEQTAKFGDIAYVVFNDIMNVIIETARILGEFVSKGITGLSQLVSSWTDSQNKMGKGGVTGFIDDGINATGRIALLARVTQTAWRRYGELVKKAREDAWNGIKTDVPTWTEVFNQTSIDLNAAGISKKMGQQNIFGDYMEKAAKDAAEARKQMEIEKKGILDAARPGLDTGPVPEPVINPDAFLKADAADSKDTYSKSIKDATDATKEYVAAKVKMDAQLNLGKITLQQYNAALEFQARKLQEVTDPYAALIRNMEEENTLLGMSAEAQDRERKYREAKNSLMEKGVILTKEQDDALKKLISTSQQMAKENPFKNYIDGIKDFSIATDQVAVNAIEGLSDQIAEFVVTGKADFASLAQSILKEFIKVAIQTQIKNLFGGWLGGTTTAPAQQVVSGAGFAGEAAANAAAEKQKMSALQTSMNNTPLRGSIDPSPTLVALDASATTLRGSFDLLGNSAYQAATALNNKVTGAVPSPITSGTMRGPLDANGVASPIAANTSMRGALPGGDASAVAKANVAFSSILAKPAAVTKTAATAYQPPAGTNDIAQTLAAASQPGVGNISPISGLNWDGRMQQEVKGLTFHHTGGRGSPSGVVDTLNSRGFGAQYIMDRDGQISQTVPDMARVAHMKDAQNGSGLTNSNAIGIEMIAKDNADLTDAQKAAGLSFIDQMKAKYPGIGDNVYGHGELNSHKRADEGMGVVDLYRQREAQKSSGMQPDPQVTGSITQADASLKTLGDTATQTGQKVQQASQTQNNAAQTTALATQQSTTSQQMNGQAVQAAGQEAQAAAPNFQQAGQSIQAAGNSAQTAGTTASTASTGISDMSGGLSSLMGPLSSVVPGIGQFGGVITSLLGSLGSGTSSVGSGLLGLFREGGLATQPVTKMRVPHYAEGTPNTTGGNGIPAVLHPNEAVIPLSRGRSVPVEMKGNGGGNTAKTEFDASRSNSPTFNLNLHGIKTADDFNKSKRQIYAGMADSFERSMRRKT